MNKKIINGTTVEYEKTFTPDAAYPFWINQCGHTYCGKDYFFHRGITSYYTIEYIISGNGYIQENDITSHPKAGDTHIFHSGSTQTFYTDPNDPWEKLWVIFYGPLADSLFEIYNLDQVLLFPELDTRSLLEKIIKICDDDKTPTHLIMSRCSIVVFELIQKLYLYTQKNEMHLQSLSIADSLKVLIDRMWNYSISLDELAAQVYCSKNHAIRVFTKKFNISPYKYISQKRLTRAKHMLRFSNIHISDISNGLGFCDSRYFSNWFKDRTGMTPSDYRNSFKDNKNV